jgi:hypothetical protein
MGQAIPIRQQSLREGSAGGSGEFLPGSQSNCSSAAPAGPSLVSAAAAKPVPKKTPPSDSGISQHDPKVLPHANGGFRPTTFVQPGKQLPRGPAVAKPPPHVQAPAGALPRPLWLQDLMWERRWAPAANPQACLFVDETKKAVLRGSISSRCA